MAKVLESLCRVPRDAIPPTPPGPEGSNGNGLVRVQRGARLKYLPFTRLQSDSGPLSSHGVLLRHRAELYFRAACHGIVSAS